MAHANLGSDDQGTSITGINITPLVDIALVLLIVFLVTAKVVVAQAIPMQLPTASTPKAVEITLAVGIDESGAMTLDGSPVADVGALARAARSRGDRGSPADVHVVIAASASASHGTVISAVDALRGAGITKIAFAVARKK